MKTKFCPKCKTEILITSFGTDLCKKDGLKSVCKVCISAYNKIYSKKYRESHTIEIQEYQKEYRGITTDSILKGNREHHRGWRKENPGKVKAIKAKRRANKLNQTPAWVNLEAIKQFYINCPPGMEVDHIIPLQGKTVSGFHVEYNLQYLTRSENSKKGNRLQHIVTT